MRHFADLASTKRWIRVVSLAVGIQLHAQDNIPVGTWRTHYSYLNAQLLETTTDKVFCAVENGLFSYEAGTGSIRRLSKLDGLSGAGISALEYSETDKVLLIGYSSGLIDLVYPEEIVTIRDIFESNLEVGKNIYEATNGPGVLYLATDLGVIVIQISNGQITENYFQIGAGGSQVAVLEIELLENELFIRTNQGVQSGNLDLNLLDFNNWTTYESTQSFSGLTRLGTQLFALNSGNLMQFMEGTWVESDTEVPENISALSAQNDQLFAFGEEQVYRLEGSTFTLEVTPDVQQLNDLALLNDQLFLADGLSGLISQNGDALSPAGPLADSYANVKVLEEQVYGFHSPFFFSENNPVVVDGFSVFENGLWRLDEIDNFPNVSDVTSFAGSRYFSSVGFGLYSEEGNEIIEDIPGSNIERDTLFRSLAAGNRLWAAGSGLEPIHYMDVEGNWTSLTSTEVFDTSFEKVSLSETGIAWALGGGTITVLDPVEMQNDLLSTSDGIPSFVLDFDISVEDNAWVATSRGPALFPTASFVFFSSDAIRPTFENQILFEDQQINAVLTDGGNRIWFGTNQGLWVFDENTSEQVAIYTEENSPLPSDVILDLAYKGSNGELFIVTDRGMVSFRSASSDAGRLHTNVNVFPNPVRPDYVGLVGIDGLARNVNVKITDINGHLVKSLDANGGTASWDLRDQRGGNVATGIYLFFSSDAEGDETFVGKIAVIR